MAVTEPAVSREDIIARNIAAVEAHFHSETPRPSTRPSPCTTRTRSPGRPQPRHGAHRPRGRTRAAYPGIFDIALAAA
jgi:hypothetical protein